LADLIDNGVATPRHRPAIQGTTMPIQPATKQPSPASDPAQKMADRPGFISGLDTQANDDSLGPWLVRHWGSLADIDPDLLAQLDL
jgi:hypothetical protein